MNTTHRSRKNDDPRLQWERSTFDKLNIWELVEFEKVVYLDADTVVLGPIHELFQYEEMTAARSGFGLFNSGVMVIRPDQHTYQALRNCLLYEEWRSRYTRGYPFPYGDQPLLNYFFEDTFLEVPTIYNTTCQRRMRGRSTRVVHYNGVVKPWHVDRKAWFAARCFWKQQRWRLWYQEYDRALETLRASAALPSEQCYWI
jgi:lipopolysaccharide biosynthesis glycosyltransferase